MSTDWWAKKLGQPQPQGIVLVPQQPQYPQQPYPPQIPQPQYPQPPPYPPQPSVVEDIGKMSYKQVAQEHDGEKISHFWKGGQAARQEGHLVCPGCGTRTGYTQFSGTTMHGNHPREHCFECGYNGAFEQGLQSTWA